MNRRPLLYSVTVFLLMLMFSSPAIAKDVTRLCNRVGIKGGELARIKTAYSDAVQSGIDDGELYSFFEVILNHGLNCDQLVKVLEESTELSRKEIPYWPIFSKVREGIAKGVPPGQIVGVVEERMEYLEHSAGVVTRLQGKGFVIKDREGAVILISSYLEKGYSPDKILERLSEKGVQYAGFAGLEQYVGQGGN